MCCNYKDDEEDGPELDGVLSHEQKEKLDDFNSNPVQERTLDFCVRNASHNQN